jgi:DNA-binding transcriptional LysR family regulator
MLERGEVHVGISLLQPIQTDNHPSRYPCCCRLTFLVCNPALSLAMPESDIRRLDRIRFSCSIPALFVPPSMRRVADQPQRLFESRSPMRCWHSRSWHGIAIVPSVLPTHRYRLRIVRLTYGRKSLRVPYAVVWDKRRALPPYAEDFCQSLAAYVREVFPISQPPARKTLRTAKRATLRR